MGVNLIVGCLLIALCVVGSMPIDDQFNDYLVKYNKQYTVEQLSLRHEIFKENMKKIEEHNKQSTFLLGVTEFADLTQEEFIKTKLSERSSYTIGGEYIPEGQAPPASVDWRANTNPQIVGPVRTMSQCGDSEVIATIDSISSDYSVSSQQDFYSFDPSYVTDCDGSGCTGENPTVIWNFITKFGLNWYYTSGVCPTGPGLGLCVSGTNCSVAGSESALQALVATRGPIPIMVDASHSSFQLYTSGIYYEPACSSTKLDLALLLVGYGSTGGQDFWIARNAWGTSWGQKGDILLARNRNNNCGVATNACYARSVKTCVCLD